ncbi:hypothetical protein A3A74_03355 [Candidatus Roizmanbacteria bacterium RIFCSPLOWO2_01_FULL_35_13]|uniref:Glutaredoxin domain-containing protein n=1 Tax=Candidatus Roizmanbacteria bacterium RIFCSPLOWO2_01_FULL_35_13 TaxID=1802055 RepID=A0A1F7IDA0_9BACT|nr:MAG: hypothetical protein A3A74_03355 [Candidatus Roizmanbacteria bacterium RIFCSPLOWO2_01_FULL_35_13]
MKITLYTVNDCQFSKQEKDYLTSHQLQFEEKNLELNKEFLTEMLAISDNFAGTPVTKIEKDDGQSVVLKGFTQAEFDEALGYKEAVAEKKDAPAESMPSEVAPVSTPTTAPSDLNVPPPVPSVAAPVTDVSAQPPTVTMSSPTPPAIVEPPTQLTQDSMSTAPVPTVQEPPAPAVEPPKAPEDPKLASVLSNLQNMSTDPVPPPTLSSTPTPPASSSMPSIPDPNFG